MILEIVQFGDPVLRAKGKRIAQIDDDIRHLAADMLETMVDANGVGLAAQQIGRALQLTVIDITGADRPSTMRVDGQEVDPEAFMPLVLINPVVTPGQGKETGVEGCLSFPEISAEITRPAAVHVQAEGLDGERVEFHAEGLLARAVQHEVDHLHGVLFIDRMNSATRAGLAGKLKRLKRGD